MQHISEIGRGDLERLKALRDKAEPGRYTCLDCRDTGLVYARRVKHGSPALGIVPCPMCAQGGDRHIENNTCRWAKGNKPCALCGAYEGEMVPPNYIPKLPVGTLSYDEVSRMGLVDPIEDPQEVDDDIPF